MGGSGSSAELVFWLMHSTYSVGWQRVKSRSAALGCWWVIVARLVRTCQSKLGRQGSAVTHSGREDRAESLVSLAPCAAPL